jgi:hypothetical protein
LPGYLYEAAGWHSLVLVFLVILSFAGWSISRFGRPPG